MGRWAALVLAAVGALAAVGFGAPPADSQANNIHVGVHVTTEGGGISDVTLDLFTQAADGSRDQWLRSVSTGPSGGASFLVEPGCYVMTLTAPEGFHFGSEGRWANRPVCATEPGFNTIPVDILYEDPIEVSIITTVGQDGSLVDGVQVDLFRMGSGGDRGTYLRSAVTGDQGVTGEARFTAVPGCNNVTFVAPEGELFGPDEVRWYTVGGCTSMHPLNFDAGLLGRTALVGIAFEQVGWVEGVTIDLFTADDTGRRLSWVRSGVTESNGEVTFDVAPGCWTLTFIAPEGLVFSDSQSGFTNRSACVSRGDARRLGAALVEPGPTGLVIQGAVRHYGGLPAADVGIDLFVADPSGGRGPWQGQVRTDAVGAFQFEAPTGCWVLTYIAPPDFRFIENESGWLNQAFCRDEPGYVGGQPVVLEPADAPDLAAPAPLAPRTELASWIVDGQLERWEGGIYQPPMLSADGTTAAFILGVYAIDHGLRTWNIETGVEVDIVDGLYQVEVVDISNDGTGVLYRQRRTSGAPTELMWWTGQQTLAIPEYLQRPINLSADGSTVAGLVDVGSSDARVETIDRSGQATATALPGPAFRFAGWTLSDDNRYLAYGQTIPEEGPRETSLYRWEIGTDDVLSIVYDRDLSVGLVELADDDDLVRLGGVSWARFSTGEITVLDYGADLGWSAYAQDFDLSGDGSTFLYPQLSPGPLFALYRPGTGEIVGVPLEGEEDHASLSGDGTRILVGEPLSDTSYRLTVLSVPHTG